MLPKTELICPEGLEVILLGGGCFWCTEAVFLRLEGVKKVIPVTKQSVQVLQAMQK